VTEEALYHEALVRLGRAAHGAGRLPLADGEATADNPLCGDRATFQLRLRGGRIEAVAHQVRGCILCLASASLIGRAAQGATPGEVAEARTRVAALLQEGMPIPAGAWADLAFFAPVSAVPSRHACVLLPFDAIAEALQRAQAGR
jgi:nitrogen fixation NifU-like protein